MRVVLCGYHWIGCRILDILIDQGYDVYVFTHESPEYIVNLELYCRKLNVPHTTDKITLQSLPFEPDVICSIYYRYIIGPSVIKKVNGKIFNLHPSLLPKYKGCSSITWAMVNNEKYTGYTYHYINEGIDTGNILEQKKIEILNYDSQQTLYFRVMFQAVSSFLCVLEKVLNEEKGRPQKGEGSYYKRGAPYNGEINEYWTADKIERFIRAMTFPPLPYAKYKGVEVKSLNQFYRLKESNYR